MSERRPCVWTEDEDGIWQTECGDAFAFDSGSPTENKAKFCQYCGAELVLVEYAEPSDEEEE